MKSTSLHMRMMAVALAMGLGLLAGAANAAPTVNVSSLTGSANANPAAPAGALNGVGSGAFNGVGQGSNGNNAVGNIGTVSPIPEPETYAMMLAGLGLMGFVAHRRRKTNTSS